MYVPGGTDRTFIKAIELLDAREIMPDVADVWGESDFLEFMDYTGRAKRIKTDTYHNYVNDMIYDTAVIATGGVAGTPGAGNPATVTIAAASHTNGGKKSFPVVGDLVKTATGEVGLVVAKDTATDDAHEITINTDSATNFVGAISQGDTLVFYSNGFAEGTGSPESRTPTLIKRQNQVQTFKRSYQISAKQKAVETEVTYNGKKFFYYKGAMDAKRHFDLDISFAMLLNPQDVTIPDQDGNDVPLTRGLEQEIKDYGIDFGYTGTGFVLSDLASLDALLVSARAPREYFVLPAAGLNRAMDDQFDDKFKQGGISYNAFGRGDGKKKAAELGFNSLHIYGRSLHKKTFEMFNHPKVTEAIGYDSIGLMIPADKIPVDHSNKKVDRMSTVYLAGDGIPKYDESYTGKFAPTGATNDISECRVHFETTVGLWVVGSEHFVRLYQS